MLQARERRGGPGAHAKDMAREGLEDEVLGAEGEHGDGHEPGELSRGGLGQHLAQSAEEPDRWHGRFGPDCLCLFGCGRKTRLQADERHGGDGTGQERDTSGHLQQALGREWVEQLAGGTGRDGKARNHHHPDQRGRARTAGGQGAFGQEGEHGGAARTHAYANQEKAQAHHGQARGLAFRDERGAPGGQPAACAQEQHAAENPWRAPAGLIGTKAHAGPQQLHHVMACHQ